MNNGGVAPDLGASVGGCLDCAVWSYVVVRCGEVCHRRSVSTDLVPDGPDGARDSYTGVPDPWFVRGRNTRHIDIPGAGSDPLGGSRVPGQTACEWLAGNRANDRVSVRYFGMGKDDEGSL